MSDRFTFATARDAFFRLETLLHAHGLRVEPGSMLDEAGLATLRVAEGEVDLTHDMRQLLPQLVGVTELANQLVRNSSHPLFGRLVPHLALLSKGVAIQVGMSSVIDDATNKIFELLVACWALPWCSDIEIDDPVKSAGGTNPDIIATINGTRWGIACKVLHSTVPQQLISIIEKGASQVQIADVDRGLVIVNMKNQILIDDYWKELTPADPTTGRDPIYDVFLDERAPFEKLKKQFTAHILAAKEKVGQKAIEDVLAVPKLIPAIILWGHTLSPVLLDDVPVIVSVRTLLVAGTSEHPAMSPSGADRKLLEALNDSAMQNP
jgi:hypothetical protein